MHSNRETLTPEAGSSPGGSLPSTDSKFGELPIELYRQTSHESMYSNRARSTSRSTSEAGSSRDGFPLPVSIEFAKLRIKSNSSPTPEPHVRRSTSSLKRPATDEPFDRDCNESDSSGKDAVHCSSNQRSPPYTNPPPNYKHQKIQSARKDRKSRMRPHPDCRRPGLKTTIDNRQESGMAMEVRQTLLQMQIATLIMKSASKSSQQLARLYRPCRPAAHPSTLTASARQEQMGDRNAARIFFNHSGTARC